MALKTEYQVGDDTYPEAYLRIQKIQLANVEYEHFKNVDDPDRPDVAQEIEWLTKQENNATVFVWVDELARQNRAQVVDWFTFEFSYDLYELDNAYQQAYQKLKTLFENSEDV